MWITFYFCGKAWCNVDNFVDRMWITSLFLNLLEIKQTTNKIINPYLTGMVIALWAWQHYLFISSRQLFYPKKLRCTFSQCANIKISYGMGVFYILKKSALAARRGMCSTLTYHSIFNLPIPIQIPTQNTQKSFENYFDAPSKSPLFPTTFSSLKIPQSHRITPKSHSKITKPQVKSTHSRTKTNNPIITT